MRLRQVDPKKIGVPEVRVTAVWDSEALEEFKRSIASLGILEPPVCVEKDGQLLLVDGQHRIVEAINEGKKRIHVVVMEGGIKECLIQNIVLNNLRGRTKSTETAQVLRVLYEEEGMGVDEIAKATGFSEDRVNKLLYISRAHPEVIQALDEERISLGHAFAMARISDVEIQKRILSQQVAYRFKVSELEEHIQNVLREKDQMVQAPPPPTLFILPEVDCFYCGRSFPVNKISNQNLCLGCSGYLIDFLRQAREMREAAAAAGDVTVSRET